MVAVNSMIGCIAESRWGEWRIFWSGLCVLGWLAGIICVTFFDCVSARSSRRLAKLSGGAAAAGDWKGCALVGQKELNRM